ncbi:hypothetical protein INR49_017327 [Caranx melampygus]|nr:hypothetical protein INR49_017327 [Caranx melampygus]
MTGALCAGLVFLSFMVLCESEPTHAGPDILGDSHGQSRLVHLTSHSALQLVNDSMAFSRADSFCRGQFSSLASLDESEDQDGAFELLQQTGLQSPIWVSDPSKVASKPVALAKQCSILSPKLPKGLP